MAGDKKKEQRGVIGAEGGAAKQLGDDLRANVLEPNLRQTRDFYMNAAPQQMSDYGETMGNFRSLMPQFQNFATTGGIPQAEEDALRARAIAPTRAVYANAQRNVNRMRSLQGGYSPGFGALTARMAREQSQGISDANTNAEAALAGMRQQGRQFGLSGMGDTGRSMTSLLGTTPGMTSMFGNQMLESTRQLGSQVGNDQNVRMGLIGAHQNAQGLPGKWEGTLGRIGDVINLGGKVGGMISGWGGSGATGVNPAASTGPTAIRNSPSILPSGTFQNGQWRY